MKKVILKNIYIKKKDDVDWAINTCGFLFVQECVCSCVSSDEERTGKIKESKRQRYRVRTKWPEKGWRSRWKFGSL